VAVRPAVLYAHGGAYCCCSSATHRRLLSELAKASGATIFAVDYRRPPEHPCPAAVDDLCRVYRHLIAEGLLSPTSTVFAGDSAGGGLVLATLVALREQAETLPAAGLLFSPWCDLADFASDSWRDHRMTDYLPQDLARLFASAYAAALPLDHPSVSPLHADLRGLPPLCIESGGCEVLSDQIAVLVRKAQAAGVEVQSSVAPDMVHVFPLLTFAADRTTTPQPLEAMDRAAAFVVRATSSSGGSGAKQGGAREGGWSVDALQGVVPV